MIIEYRGNGEKFKYFRDLEAVPGGTISPGGVVQILRCSRPFVSKLYTKHPDIRAWAYFSGAGTCADLVEVSVVDVVSYALRLEKYKNISEILLIPQEILQEVNAIILNRV